MLLFYESTYIFMRLSLHAQRKKNKSEKAQSNKLSAFNYFSRLPRQSRMFPDRETYGSESKNIRFTQRKHTIDKFVSYTEKTHQSPILRKLIVSRISFSMKFSSHPAISLFLPIGIFFSFLLSTAVTIFVIIE